MFYVNLCERNIPLVIKIAKGGENLLLPSVIQTDLIFFLLPMDVF